MTEQTHGTAGRYRGGCRCGPCTAAESQRQKDLKLRRLRSVPTAADTSAPPAEASTVASSPAGEVGPVESALITDRQTLGDSANAALWSTARRLAQILDDPRMMAVWPTTARAIAAVIGQLERRGGKRQTGRLAAVRRAGA